MNEAEKQKIIDELKTLYEELKSYKRLLNLKGRLSDKDRLRETLVRKAGALKPIIIGLTGKEHISRFGMVHNIWDVGLTAHRVSDICNVALDYCIDAVNEAIGKLESDIKKDRTEEAWDTTEKPTKKQPVEKEIRKQLSGTPEEIAPHVVRVAQELQFPQGFNCYAEEQSYKSSQFSKQFTIYRITGVYTPGVIWNRATEEELPRSVGTITLQSLPNDRTLLIAEHTLPSFDSEGSYFGSFSERLSLEFKNLGIEETTVKKPAANDKKSIYQKIWYEVKEFIASIIAKFLAEKLK